MRTVSVLVLSLLSVSVFAADWAGYRGPEQTGRSTEDISIKFPAGGPKVLWRVPTVGGFSSFTIGGGKAFIQLLDGVNETCSAFDAATGKAAWSVQVDQSKYSGGSAGAPDNNGGDGPRSTPAYSDGLVYVYTPNMNLWCFDAASGKKVWMHEVLKEFSGKNIGWNSAASPVIDGEMVFVACGGPSQSCLAFNKKTGAVAWKSQTETITHATPVVATILGVRQVIFFMQSGLVAVNAADGALLWKFPFPFKVSTAASPVVSGDIVYCSAGYGVGGGACKITKDGNAFKATQLWMKPGDNAVANHWSTPLVKDGYLYGMFSFKKWGTGPVKCVEIATGAIKWEQPNFGAGHMILVNDKLVGLTDFGDVVLIEPSPAAYKELGRFKAIAGKCWSTPSFSDGKLYVRSTKEGACLDCK